MIEVKNLTCGYDSFSLQDINISIGTGEIVGIAGPNGSGKTTLLKAISRVLKPHKGEVLFDGVNIWRMNTGELAGKMAVVSQSFELEFMTVEEFVLLGRIPYFNRFQFIESKKDLEAAYRAMHMTNTFRLKDRPILEISGGEKQLAVIARALAQEPKLLVLDEPTSHLDITHQVAVLDLVRRLNKELGLTIIMVLHDLNLASEYCKRIILINDGKIYKKGSPREVLTYQVIEEVYKTVVVVKDSPITGKPYVFLVPEEEKNRKRKPL